jgi:hypothetical protein
MHCNIKTPLSSTSEYARGAKKDTHKLHRVQLLNTAVCKRCSAGRTQKNLGAVVEVTVRDEPPKRSTEAAAESKQHEQ